MRINDNTNKNNDDVIMMMALNWHYRIDQSNVFRGLKDETMTNQWLRLNMANNKSCTLFIPLSTLYLSHCDANGNCVIIFWRKWRIFP